jgi:Zn ribbon nucleic-acid-binding protein
MTKSKTLSPDDPKTTLHPTCPKCAEQLHLTLVEPVVDGIDHRTFECASCGHSEQRMVKFHQ